MSYCPRWRSSCLIGSYLREVVELSGRLTDQARMLSKHISPLKDFGADLDLAGHIISHLTWEHLQDPQDELKEVFRKRKVWKSMLRMFPL